MPAKLNEGGARSWVLRVQYRGNRRDFGLGAYVSKRINEDYSLLPLVRRKSLTLEEAREKARIGRGLAKAGIDPSVEWQREVLVVPTFATAAREYHRLVVNANAQGNEKQKAQWLNTRGSYVFGKIGKRPVNEIDAPDVQAVLMPIWLTVPETARRVRQRIFVVLDYCKGKGWRDTEAPARAVNQLMGGIKQPKRGDFEAMPWGELPGFMTRLRGAEASVGRLALRFLILTAARSGEVRGATWAEFDLETAEWRIPGERMKMGELHVVPLVPAAVDILRKMQETFGAKSSEPVFPGLKGKPMSDATLAMAMRMAGGSKATVHGLRSTFRDWAAEQGFANDWAEAALSHSVSGQEGKTIAAYKRTTFYTQRRDKLMPAWAHFASQERINVISLAEA